MSLENVKEGTYQGVVVDHGLREIEKLRQLAAFIVFEFSELSEDGGATHQIKWESFLFKKDGSVNKYTQDTLAACGFKSKNITDLNSSLALDQKKLLSLTLEREQSIKDPSKYYLKVKWVNDSSESFVSKVDSKKLAGYDLSRFNAELVKANTQTMSSQLGVKNHAPQGAQPPQLDTKDELGF